MGGSDQDHTAGLAGVALVREAETLRHSSRHATDLRDHAVFPARLSELETSQPEHQRCRDVALALAAEFPSLLTEAVRQSPIDHGAGRVAADDINSDIGRRLALNLASARETFPLAPQCRFVFHAA